MVAVERTAGGGFNSIRQSSRNPGLGWRRFCPNRRLDMVDLRNEPVTSETMAGCTISPLTRPNAAVARRSRPLFQTASSSSSTRAAMDAESEPKVADRLAHALCQTANGQPILWEHLSQSPLWVNSRRFDRRMARGPSESRWVEMT